MAYDGRYFTRPSAGRRTAGPAAGFAAAPAPGPGGALHRARPATDPGRATTGKCPHIWPHGLTRALRL